MFLFGKMIPDEVRKEGDERVSRSERGETASAKKYNDCLLNFASAAPLRSLREIFFARNFIPEIATYQYSVLSGSRFYNTLF